MYWERKGGIRRRVLGRRADKNYMASAPTWSAEDSGNQSYVSWTSPTSLDPQESVPRPMRWVQPRVRVS